MNHTVVRIFDSNEQAEHARDSLVAAGFGADAVTMRVTGDEAGAVSGNFYVGNPLVDGDISYRVTYADARPLSLCIMTVDVGDAAAMLRAVSILDENGARAGDPAAGG